MKKNEWPHSAKDLSPGTAAGTQRTEDRGLWWAAPGLIVSIQEGTGMGAGTQVRGGPDEKRIPFGKDTQERQVQKLEIAKGCALEIPRESIATQRVCSVDSTGRQDG